MAEGETPTKKDGTTKEPIGQYLGNCAKKVWRDVIDSLEQCYCPCKNKCPPANEESEMDVVGERGPEQTDPAEPDDPLSQSPTLEQLKASQLPQNQWTKLGKCLGVDEHKLEEIGNDFDKNDEALVEMCKAWLESGKDVTWSNLVDALRSMKLFDKADQIQRDRARK